MAELLGTIYTLPYDTWDTLSKLSTLTRDELVELNPHLHEIREIEAGIPVDVPHAKRLNFIDRSILANTKTGVTPYQIAQRELAMDVCEISGGRDNPRIRLYHSTTKGGAQPDEIAWCSSFVNYCVEQAGLRGTDSKAARSWLRWGQEVREADWMEGDIVVFWRNSPNCWKGHVGFLVDWQGSRPNVLGGTKRATRKTA